jgi:hypothetical protein
MPGPMKSKRPKARSSAPMTSLRPKMRPSDIGASPSGGTRGIDPMENYSPEDYDRLMDSYEGKTQKFGDGGSVRGCKSVQSSGTGFSGNY